MVAPSSLHHGTPPADIVERLQKSSNRILQAALQSPNAQPDPRVLECLGIALNLKARESLESMGTAPLELDHYLPLRLAERLASSTNLPFTLILDVVLAYPTALASVHKVVDDSVKRDETLVSTFHKKAISTLFRILTAENRRITPPTKQPSRPAESDKRSQHPFARVSYTLLLLARAHHLLAESILNTGSALEILRSSYAKIEETTALSDVAKIHTKQTFLILLHTLLSTLQQTEREWKLVNMSEEAGDRVRRVLKDAALEEDYRFFFEDAASGGPKEEGQKKPVLGEVEMDILRSLTMGDVNPTERGHAQEARIAPIKAIFPQIPSYLLISALSHPRFDLPISADGSDPAVEALTNALLEDSLPPRLDKLRRALRCEDTESPSVPETEKGQTPPPVSQDASPPTTTPDPAALPKRQNIWNDMPMNFEKLKVENERKEASLEDTFNNIPDQLREQILRLQELQNEEEEAERHAEREERNARRLRAEAARTIADGGSGSRAVLREPRTAAFEEELGDDDEDAARERVAMRGVTGDSEDSDGGEVVLNTQHDDLDDEIVENLEEAPDETFLELEYLHNRQVFNRDPATRKSQRRSEMRDVMGWTDERIEDWAKLMDRNPRKTQILGRHAYTRTRNELSSPSTSRDDATNRHRGGRGGGRGGSRGDGGNGAEGGGGRGGRGGSSRGGRGRGQNKSSRGHQNAARTRGNDKKMQKAAGWT